MSLILIGSKSVLDKIYPKFSEKCLLIDILEINYIDFIPRRSNYYWFTSPHAINSFLNKNLLNYLLDAKFIGVVGNRSQNILINKGISTDKIICQNNLKDLAKSWIFDEDIVFYRVKDACQDYKDIIKNNVLEIPVYTTFSKEITNNLKISNNDKLIFTSPRSVIFFLDKYKKILDRKLQIYTLGLSTYHKLKSYEFTNITIADKPDLNLLIEKIILS